MSEIVTHESALNIKRLYREIYRQRMVTLEVIQEAATEHPDNLYWQVMNVMFEAFVTQELYVWQRLLDVDIEYDAGSTTTVFGGVSGRYCDINSRKDLPVPFFTLYYNKILQDTPMLFPPCDPEGIHKLLHTILAKNGDLVNRLGDLVLVAIRYLMDMNAIYSYIRIDGTKNVYEIHAWHPDRLRMFSLEIDYSVLNDETIYLKGDLNV